MRMRREEIARAVWGAVDDVNGQLPRSKRLAKSADTQVLGPGATLDSLGLVNFIAAVQQRIESASGVRLTLVDGEFLIGDPGRVVTLDGFVDHVEATLEKRGHA
jgi:hypothetical protein